MSDPDDGMRLEHPASLDLRPFRPRRGPLVALVLAVVVACFFVLLGALVPDTAMVSWTPLDRVLFASLGLAMSAGFLRYATIRAVPSEDGLMVRNLLLTRQLSWDEIVLVTMSDGDPWPTLDLADTDEVAVMAIQRSDGPRSLLEAQRLATLVHTLGSGVEGPSDRSRP